MAKKNINIGVNPGDGTGDVVRAAFSKTKDNFDELYSRPVADMNKSQYDTDNSGVVDAAEKISGIDASGALTYYGKNAAGAVGFHIFSDDKVAAFVDFASFPIAGFPNVIYIDQTDFSLYLWDDVSNVYFEAGVTHAYVDAKVEDVIVDGVVDKAPSQNAVFDKLALKANDADVVKSVNGLTPDAAGAVTVGSSLLSKSFTYTSGAQTFTADFDIVQVDTLLVGNIALQRDSQYTVSGAVVTITDTLTSGAVIELNYWKANAVNATNYTKAESDAASNLKAPLSSPTFTGTVTLPTGTANKIPKYTSAGVLGDSVITELADSNVGINTTNPSANLEINGDLRVYDSTLNKSEIFLGGASLVSVRNMGDNIFRGMGMYGGSFTVYSGGWRESLSWSSAIIKINSGNFNSDFSIGMLGSTGFFFQGSTGNVSIGTDTPSQKLDVVGNIKLSGIHILGQYTTATRPAYVKGAQFFDTTINKMVIGGATAWEEVTSS